MKKGLFLLAFLVCAVAARLQMDRIAGRDATDTTSACADAADTEAIRQIAGQWKDGYNSGNAARVASLYDEDADYLTQHFVTGIIHGRPAIQAYVQRGFDAQYHFNSISIISIGCSGELAYTVGRYESTNAGQKAAGVNLVVVRRIGGHWLIVAHEAAVPDPATAVRHLDTAPLPYPSDSVLVLTAAFAEKRRIRAPALMNLLAVCLGLHRPVPRPYL